MPPSTQVVVQRRVLPKPKENTPKVYEIPSKGRQLKETYEIHLRSKQILIFTCLFVGYAVYNLSRKAISYVTPVLMAGGILTQNGAGLICSSQSAAYAISKFFAGVVSDKLSARMLFSIGLLVSGMSTILVAYLDNPNMWILLWFMNGLAQGCGWPACSKLLKKWFSSKHFGTCWSVLTASGNVAGAVGPMISAFILMTFDWKISVLCTGFVTVLMGAATLFSLSDQPEDVGLSVGEEVPRDSGKSMSQSTEETMTWKELLHTPLLWIIAGSYLVAFGIKTALCDWTQVYLIQELNLSQIQASSFLSSFETGGFTGGILAGIITDKISKGTSGYNRRLMVASTFLMATAFGLHLMTFYFNPFTTQIFTSCVAFVLGASVFGPISIFGIVASESFPQSISGSAHAVVALAANGGAILAGWPLSKVVEIFGWTSVLSSLEVCAISVVFLMYISGPWQSIRKSKQS